MSIENFLSLRKTAAILAIILSLENVANAQTYPSVKDPAISGANTSWVSNTSVTSPAPTVIIPKASSTTGAAPTIWDEYDKSIQNRSTIASLGPNLFGDEVNLSDGSLSFSATDVSIPGNNSLPVEFKRTFSASNRKGYFLFDAPLGNWNLDIPRISASYLADWPTQRCSTTTASQVIPTGLTSYKQYTDAANSGLTEYHYTHPKNYWQGLQANMPGGGEMLLANTAASKPSLGGPYYWSTASHTRFSCLSAILNGTGEGFLAITTDGTKYLFNWMALELEPDLGDGLYTYWRQKRFMYVSRVEDRFGNFVNYTYSNASNMPAKLTSITASDGRQLNISYVTSYQNRSVVSSVSDGTRTWQYSYANLNTQFPSLKKVTLPDNSSWDIDFETGINSGGPLSFAYIRYWYYSDPRTASRSCSDPGIASLSTFSSRIKHPSGAVAEFTIKNTRQGRSNVPQNCYSTVSFTPKNPRWYNFDNYAQNRDVVRYDVFSLSRKSISGPGLSAQTWDYTYANTGVGFAPSGTLCQSDACSGKNITTVNNTTDGTWQKYTFGNSFEYNEGKLLSTETGAGAVVSKTDTSNYEFGKTGLPFQTPIAFSPQRSYVSAFSSEYIRPLKSSVTNLGGANFTSTVNSFNEYASPTSVTEASSLGYSRTNTIAYEHNLNSWVIEQIKSVTNVDTNKVVTNVIFDPVTAMPLRTYSFDQLQNTMTYNGDGTVATMKDANDHVVSLGNYKRGVPQSVTFPDNTTLNSVVDDKGWLSSVTDQIGSVTTYGYDAMGRVSSVAPPTGDTVAWAGSTTSFAPVTFVEYGLPAGHWKETISKGNFRKETYVDAMWRPVVIREYDSTKISETQRFTRMAYDVQGRKIFESYPGTTDALTTGVRTTYDSLGRILTSKADSELGVLTTTYEYLSGFQVRVTNPRGFSTTSSFQVFATPNTESPEVSVSPEGVTTTILRDVFGKPLTLTRSTNAGATNTRQYVYDDHQRLCKRVEPETGASLIDYDAAGNVIWSVQGSSLTSNMCDRSNVAAEDKTIRNYSSMNRLLTVDIPNSANDLSYTYFDDGALKTVANGTNSWAYTYNKLRLPVSETLFIDGRTKAIAHGYDVLGQENNMTYPSGLNLPFPRNALGQVNQAGTYATNVSYFSNGGMSGFTYGNGILHSLTQNARFLPARSRDMDGTSAILDDSYVYDGNGNVESIADGTPGAPGNRTMTYDGRDRLTQVNSPNSWWITNTFTYDGLDNILTNFLGARLYTYLYEGSTGRLTRIVKPYEVPNPPTLAANSLTMTALAAGGGGTIPPNQVTTVRTYSYDAQGNVTSTGTGNQSFIFDRANRLIEVTGKERYEYDGHGRRVKIIRLADNKIRYPIYSVDGQLITEDDYRNNQSTDYIYLNGSIVAKNTAPVDTTNFLTRYLHTDALGTPVYETDSAKVLARVERYSPFGEPNDGTYDQGPGFTGHVTDTITQLTYAQQRYYDPLAGRFLSVDPVETDPSTGESFNRYNYGNNNPYKFTDPDGRWSAKAHDKLIEHAFKDKLSKQDIKTIQDSSRAFDKRTQDASDSNKHSMAKENQSSKDAKAGRDKFIGETLVAARDAARGGDRTKALMLMGEAIHPVMDSSSPEHTDKNGDPKVWRGIQDAFGHSPTDFIGNETSTDITPAIYTSQDKRLNAAYDWVFKEEK